MSAAFETAREFADHGLRVFPVKDKQPLTPNGWKDASTDERQLLHWDKRWPTAEWAAACGANEVGVIDIDPRKGPDPREVIDKYDLGDRPTVWTGDSDGVRGAHVYASGKQTGNNVGVVRGIDIIGGYVVLPGSRHASGVPYEWANDLRPWNTPLAPVPESLRPVKTTGAGVMPDRKRKVPHGQRHDHLEELVIRLVRSGITDAFRLERMLRVEYETSCEQTPPARADEFINLARWGAQSDIAKRERATRAGRPAHTDDCPRGAGRFVDMSDAMRDAHEPLPYRVKPLAVDGMVTLVVGRTGSNKTWLCMLACASVQGGEPLAGLNCRNGPALYLDVENGR